MIDASVGSARVAQAVPPDGLAALEAAVAPESGTDPRIPGYRFIKPLGRRRSGPRRSWRCASPTIAKSRSKISTANGSATRRPGAFRGGYEILDALNHLNMSAPSKPGVLPTGELWHATEYVSGRMSPNTWTCSTAR